MKKIIIIIASFLVLGISICNSDSLFHDESRTYYLQNNNTKEIRQVHKDRFNWNGDLVEKMTNKLSNLTIPTNNIYSNWNLVGYYYKVEHDNPYRVVCKRHADGRNYEFDGQLDISSKNKSECEKYAQDYVYKDFSIKDFELTDNSNFLLNFGVMYFPYFLKSLLINFFVLLSILHLLSFLRIKLIHIIYITLFLCPIFESYLYLNGLSEFESTHNIFLGMLLFYIISMYKIPFYLIGTIIFYRKYLIGVRIKIKSSAILSSIINISLFFIFTLLNLIIGIYIDVDIPYNFRLYLLIGFFILLGVYLIFRKKTEKFIEEKIFLTNKQN